MKMTEVKKTTKLNIAMDYIKSNPTMANKEIVEALVNEHKFARPSAYVYATNARKALGLHVRSHKAAKTATPARKGPMRDANGRFISKKK